MISYQINKKLENFFGLKNNYFKVSFFAIVEINSAKLTASKQTSKRIVLPTETPTDQRTMSQNIDAALSGLSEFMNVNYLCNLHHGASAADESLTGLPIPSRTSTGGKLELQAPLGCFAKFETENATPEPENVEKSENDDYDIQIGLNPGAGLTVVGCIHYKTFPGAHFKFSCTFKDLEKNNTYYSRLKPVATAKIEKDHVDNLTTSELAKLLAPKKNKVIVIFGDASMAKVIQGQFKTPLRRIYHELKLRKNCTVVSIDEFKTTELCNKCYETMDGPTIWRDFKCNECSQVFYLNNRKQKQELNCSSCNKKTLEKICRKNLTEIDKHTCDKCYRQYALRVNNGKCACQGELIKQPALKSLETYCKRCNLMHYQGRNCSACKSELVAVDSESKHGYRFCSKYILS